MVSGHKVTRVAIKSKKFAPRSRRLDDARMVSSLRAPLPESRWDLRPRRRWRRPQPDGAAAPIVKWVGGKGKLAAELAGRAPLSYRRYFEPFVGGGALFFHLRPRAAWLC